MLYKRCFNRFFLSGEHILLCLIFSVVAAAARFSYCSPRLVAGVVSLFVSTPPGHRMEKIRRTKTKTFTALQDGTQSGEERSDLTEEGREERRRGGQARLCSPPTLLLFLLLLLFLP